MHQFHAQLTRRWKIYWPDQISQMIASKCCRTVNNRSTSYRPDFQVDCAAESSRNEIIRISSTKYRRRYSVKVYTNSGRFSWSKAYRSCSSGAPGLNVHFTTPTESQNASIPSKLNQRSSEVSCGYTNWEANCDKSLIFFHIQFLRISLHALQFNNNKKIINIILIP